MLRILFIDDPASRRPDHSAGLLHLLWPAPRCLDRAAPFRPYPERSLPWSYSTGRRPSVRYPGGLRREIDQDDWIIRQRHHKAQRNPPWSWSHQRDGPRWDSAWIMFGSGDPRPWRHTRAKLSQLIRASARVVFPMPPLLCVQARKRRAMVGVSVICLLIELFPSE